MDILPILRLHRRNLALRIESLRGTTRRERAMRRELLAGLRDELESHALAERRLVHARLHKLQTGSGGSRVADPGPIHRFLLMLVGELETTDPGDPSWLSKLGVLGEWIEVRLSDAERGAFRSVRARLDRRPRWSTETRRASASGGDAHPHPAA